MSEKPETLEKNWTKIGVMIALLSFIVATILGVAALSNFDISLKYFTINIVLLFGVFVYFEYLKDYRKK
ncbi:MAG: hypothetical protein ABSF36_03555 [Candidatus Methanomethylicaceae archaeon]|jgi:hypothetical protein